MATTASFVFSKTATESPTVSADLTSLMQQGETITNLAIGTVFPVTVPPMAATLVPNPPVPPISPVVMMLLSGGVNETSYGYKVTVTTNARVFEVQMAVAVTDAPWVPYTTQSPGAYQDLVGSLEAGKSAMSVAMFTFPPDQDVSGGFVYWDLIAQDGTIYASGNAFSYDIINNGMVVIVKANAIINVPSTVPPSMIDQRYQIRYTLELPLSNAVQPDPLTQLPQQNRYQAFETLEVLGYGTVPLGTQPQIETQGTPAKLSYVADRMYDNMGVEMYVDNTNIVPFTPIPALTRTADGYYYEGTFNTTQMAPSLVPYHVVWKYWMNNDPNNVYQEGADLWIINPSILTAILDVKAKVNKARTTLYGKPDMLFPHTTIMTWLRRAMDAFNAGYGVFTNFTMLNAKGPIREFWLLYAEMYACQSQYLAEGEKAFDFQGQAISLNVDRAQYYDGLADKIQSRLDNEFKPIKQNLVYRGATGGDGSQDPSQLKAGATAAVGITITPATPWTRVLPSGRF